MMKRAIMIPIIFVFVLGSIDFLMAFYQWKPRPGGSSGGSHCRRIDPVAQGLGGSQYECGGHLWQSR